MVEFADLEDPLFAGGPELVAGRAPSAPDEVAISETAADELGLLADGGSRSTTPCSRLSDGAAARGGRGRRPGRRALRPVAALVAPA